MDYNFIQSVLGLGRQAPQDPAGQAIASQTPLLQTNSLDNRPGMAPGPQPRGLDGGYPGQPVSPANFSQQPPQNYPPAYAGPAPGTLAYSRDRAFDQAGSDFGQGRYAAGVGDAIRGAGIAIPAAVAGAYHSVAASAARPLGDSQSASSPLAHGAQELWRGLTGASPDSPPLPTFPGVSPAPAPAQPFASPAPALTNGDMLAASLRAAAPQVNPLQPQPSQAGPTRDNWMGQVNALLHGQGPGAGHAILAAANAGQPFADIRAAIPQLHQQEWMDQGRQNPTANYAPQAQGARPAAPQRGFTPEMLSKLPADQAAAITAMGGISAGHLNALLQANAPRNVHNEDPTTVARRGVNTETQNINDLESQFPGLEMGQNGQVVIPSQMFDPTTGAAFTPAQIAQTVHLYTSAYGRRKQFMLPLNILNAIQTQQ